MLAKNSKQSRKHTCWRLKVQVLLQTNQTDLWKHGQNLGKLLLHNVDLGLSYGLPLCFDTIMYVFIKPTCIVWVLAVVPYKLSSRVKSSQFLLKLCDDEPTFSILFFISLPVESKLTHRGCWPTPLMTANKTFSMKRQIATIQFQHKIFFSPQDQCHSYL